MTTIRATLLANACLYLAMASGAVAQTAPEAADDEGVGEIVVTAQRKAESINDVGMAIQAFGGEELKAMRVNDVKDLTSLVPSFTVSQSYQGVPTYTLRGIGFNTINLSATSTVGTYVDEVAYAYPIMNTGPVMDLERVEVLKGPQGTLYGRNTTAGLINFITAKPTSEFEGALSADLGNYETYNVEGHVSGPLTDTISARIAFKSENSDKGWQRSNSRPGERLGEVEKYGARLSLRFQPTSETDINLSYTYWRNKSDVLAGQAIGFTPATDPANGGNTSFFNTPGLAAYIAANQPTDSRQADWAPFAQRSADIGTGLGLDGPLAENNRFHGIKFRVDQELSDAVTFVSLTSYSDFKRDGLLDWSGAPYEILLQKVDGRIKSFAEDFHFEGKNDYFDWLIGGYYARDKLVDSNRTLLGQNANVGLIRFLGINGNPALGFPPLALNPFNTGGYTATDLAQSFRTYQDIGNLKNTTYSLFGNANFKLTSQLKLGVGVRVTKDKQDADICSRDVNGNMLPNVNVVNRTLYFAIYGKLAAPITQGQCVSFDPVAGQFTQLFPKLREGNVAWRASLDWSPTQDILVFASVSHGAKAGQAPINAANIASQNEPAKQEILTAYEAGIKATLFDRALQANFGGFYYDYKDKQISSYFADPIYTALSHLVNIPKSEAYGFEGDLTLRPMRGLTLNATALLLHTEVKGYVGTNAAGQTQNFDGAEFLYSPKFSGSLSAIYDAPISENLALQLTLNGRYQSKTHTTFEVAPLYDIKAYGVLNGSIGVHSVDDRWSLSIWGRNLTQEYYWGGISSNANTVVRFPGAPRTFGATVGVKF